MKIDILTFGSHAIEYTSSSDKSVNQDSQCGGSDVTFPPSDSKEITQHYGKTMYTGDAPVGSGANDGERDKAVSTGPISLPDEGDTRHKSGGKSSSDHTPGMPGA
jgi:hypothetical protein